VFHRENSIGENFGASAAHGSCGARGAIDEFCAQLSVSERTFGITHGKLYAVVQRAPIAQDNGHFARRGALAATSVR
jgi:hypothetical protein